MADIEETFSRKIEVAGAVGLLDGIAAALGGVKGSFKTAYEKANAVQFRVCMPERHAVGAGRTSSPRPICSTIRRLFEGRQALRDLLGGLREAT
jgi:hypothetical protein